KPPALRPGRFWFGCRHPNRPPRTPGRDLSIHVSRLGDDGRPTHQLSPSGDHAAVEVVKHVTHVALTREVIEVRVEFTILGAQQDGWRTESSEVFTLNLATDPPIRIMVRADSLERLTRSRQVVEIAAANGDLDRGLHELVLILCGELSRGRFLLSI